MDAASTQKHHCKLKSLQDKTMLRHWAEEEIKGKTRAQIKKEAFKVSFAKWQDSLSVKTLLTFVDDYLFEEDDPGLKPYAHLDCEVAEVEGGGAAKFFNAVFWSEVWEGISKDIDEQIKIIQEEIKTREMT